MFFIFQVLYKHQLELDEKKKKALDKQLEFLLGQTERFSPFPFFYPALLTPFILLGRPSYLL